MKRKVVAISVVVLSSLAIIGCGGSPSVSSLVKSGYFIDAAVVGADYSGSEGSTGQTGANGSFTFKPGETLDFKIGKLKLGSVKMPTNAKNGIKITPVDLAKGVKVNKITAADLNDTKVIEILRVLQNADRDGDPTNGIELDDYVKQIINSKVNSGVIKDYVDGDETTDEAGEIGSELGHDINETEAKTHFEDTIRNDNDIEYDDGSNGNGGDGNSNDD